MWVPKCEKLVKTKVGTVRLVQNEDDKWNWQISADRVSNGFSVRDGWYPGYIEEQAEYCWFDSEEEAIKEAEDSVSNLMVWGDVEEITKED